jgi:hypothetical protein
MVSEPEFRILRGRPTQQQKEAIRRALMKLWAQERASAVPGLSPWVAAARAEAAGQDLAFARAAGSPGAWRLSGRLTEAVATQTQTGRGDAK